MRVASSEGRVKENREVGRLTNSPNVCNRAGGAGSLRRSREREASAETRRSKVDLRAQQHVPPKDSSGKKFAAGTTNREVGICLLIPC